MDKFPALFGQENSTKNLIFNILTKEFPLRLIHLTNYIRNRYGKQVTFQAVRKATLQLTEQGTLKKENNMFSINTQWLRQIETSSHELQKQLCRTKNPSIKSIGPEASVFTFNSLSELMKFWQTVIDNWIQKPEAKNSTNFYRTPHTWEVILFPEKEREVMTQLVKKGIKSTTVITSNTPLDQYTKKFYKDIGVQTYLHASTAEFDRQHAIATYGDMIVQTNYPREIFKAIDAFFKSNKALEQLDTKKLHQIVKRNQQIKLTVVQNADMAKHINNSIIGMTKL